MKTVGCWEPQGTVEAHPETEIRFERVRDPSRRGDTWVVTADHAGGVEVGLKFFISDRQLLDAEWGNLAIDHYLAEAKAAVQRALDTPLDQLPTAEEMGQVVYG